MFTLDFCVVFTFLACFGNHRENLEKLAEMKKYYSATFQKDFNLREAPKWFEVLFSEGHKHKRHFFVIAKSFRSVKMFVLQLWLLLSPPFVTIRWGESNRTTFTRRESFMCVINHLSLRRQIELQKDYQVWTCRAEKLKRLLNVYEFLLTSQLTPSANRESILNNLQDIRVDCCWIWSSNIDSWD